jgi:epoxyqueuosine reductase
VLDASYTDELCALARAEGLDAVGVASAEPFLGTRRHLEDRKAAGLHGGMAFTYRNPARSTEPGTALRGARSLVVGARSYQMAEPRRPAGPSGRVARYAWVDHYASLRSSLTAVAEHLRSDGWKAVVFADDNSLVDREAARRAGLGWYGKNANLLLPGAGSWYVLGSVITDAPLIAAHAPVPDGCGACRRCIDGCPTGAIVAPGVVDARRCLAWLVQRAGIFPPEYRAALGDRIYGCDDCQEVCPPNRRLRGNSESAESAEASVEAWVPLLGLLAATDDELLARHGRWYIPQRNPRWLRRNALVALGNCADGADPAVADALRCVLAGNDAVLRAHAVWAAARLGRDDLVALVRDDPSPDVRDELVAVSEASGAAPRS